jgi:hypothetical protein
MLPLQEQDSPLTIRSTTHTIVDALTTGELQNSTTRTIVAYKMGWMRWNLPTARASRQTSRSWRCVP